MEIPLPVSEKQQIRFESHSVKRLSHFKNVINLKRYTSDVVMKVSKVIRNLLPRERVQLLQPKKTFQ